MKDLSKFYEIIFIIWSGIFVLFWSLNIQNWYSNKVSFEKLIYIREGYVAHFVNPYLLCSKLS